MMVTYGTLLGTVVTAVATIMLWWVTRTLARETQRLVDAGASPHVVVTIDPNMWAMQQADMQITNTGNATAYDIQVNFDPALQNENLNGTNPVPFQRVSVLKPGQTLKSHLGSFNSFLDKKYTVSANWTRGASNPHRQGNVYLLDMKDKNGMARLGAVDPLIQVADQLKKIQENWVSVAKSHNRLQVDVFDNSDRMDEEREREKFRRQVTKKARVPKTAKAKYAESSGL
jgi:hypothetical protein